MPEYDQKKSSMEQEKTLHKGSLTLTKHDSVSDDELSSNTWDGNAADDMSNAPTGPVTHSKSKHQNLTAEDFIIMSYGVSWLTNGWKNVSTCLGRS